MQSEMTQIDPRVLEIAEHTGLDPQRIIRAVDLLVKRDRMSPSDVLDHMLWMGDEIKALVDAEDMPSQALN